MFEDISMLIVPPAPMVPINNSLNAPSDDSLSAACNCYRYTFIPRELRSEPLSLSLSFLDDSFF